MTRRTLEIVAFCIALLVAALAVHAWLTARDEQQRLAATLAAQKQIIDSADANERANQSSLASALAQIEKLKRTTQTPEQILAALPKYLPLPQPITLSRPSAANVAQGASPEAFRAESEQGIAAPAEGSRSASVSPANSPPVNPWRDTAHSATPPGGAADVECGGLPPLSPAEACSGANPTIVPAAPCDPAGNCSAQIPAADLKPLFDYVQDCRACQAELAAAQKNSADDAAKIAALTRQRDAAITASKGGSFFRRLRRNALWFAVGAAAGYVGSKR